MVICFAWSGFPQYAARCVGAFVRQTANQVVVVATRPRVPVAGMEDLCGCPVIWVEPNADPSLNFVVDVLVVSGWGIPVFNRLAGEVRQRKGRVVCMIDNNFRLTLRECIKAIRFRLCFRRRYDGFLVPGKSGRKLLRFYGVSAENIAEGLYSADANLFHDGGPIVNREKRIIYVGQLCERKNVMGMCSAFAEAVKRKDEQSRGWSLHLYGCGPLRRDVDQFIQNRDSREQETAAIAVHDFLQPEELAEKYREARAFCLASYDEHWGVVVHEAALSGCVLLLSDAIGAKDDFLAKDNGFSFSSHSVRQMAHAFECLFAMDDERQRIAHDVSLTMARGASVDKFIAGLRALRVG